jgi:hypothetical protein
MNAEALGILLLVLMPLLLATEGIIAILIWRATGHAAPLLLGRSSGAVDRPVISAEAIAVWLAGSSITMGVAFLVLFTAEYAILFTLGTVAASVGLIASIGLLGSLPIVWALAILHRAGRR